MKAVFVISGRRSIYSDIFDNFELAAQAVHNRNIEDSKEFIQACQDSLANALRQYDQLIKAGPLKQ